MSKDKVFSPIFVLIVAATLCAFLMGQGANAGTSIYLDKIGSSTELAGIGALTFSASAAVSRMIAGPLSDLKGRAIVMVAGSVIMIIGTTGPLMVNTDGAFIFWRILQGLGFAATTTASATAAADVLPFARLGEGIGYYGLGQAIAMSIGPALAIFLASTDPPENFYGGLISCSVLALVFSLLCRYEKHPEKLNATSEYRIRWEKGEIQKKKANTKLSPRAIAASILEPTALPGTIPIMFIATSFGFGIFFMGIFGESLGIGNPGIFYTLSAVSMVVVRLTSGKFMDKVRPIFIMIVAVVFGLIAYSLSLMCALDTIEGARDVLFYLSGIPYGVSLGLALPINQTVAVRLSPPDRWGAANGLFLLGNDVAIGASSAVWGFTVAAWGYAPTIGIIMGCIALSAFVAFLYYPKKGHTQ